jgi:hypothetical protein
MDDFRIPFVLWFSGEPPPDLAAITEPVVIAVSFHRNGRTMPRTSEITDDRTAVAGIGDVDG